MAAPRSRRGSSTRSRPRVPWPPTTERRSCSGAHFGDAVAAQEGVAPLDHGTPDLEVLLVVGPIAFLVGVFELVEGGILRVEQLAVPPEESLVDHPGFTHRHPFRHPTATRRPSADGTRAERRVGSASPQRSRASRASLTVKRPS